MAEQAALVESYYSACEIHLRQHKAKLEAAYKEFAEAAKGHGARVMAMWASSACPRAPSAARNGSAW